MGEKIFLVFNPLFPSINAICVRKINIQKETAHFIGLVSLMLVI